MSDGKSQSLNKTTMTFARQGFAPVTAHIQMAAETIIYQRDRSANERMRLPASAISGSHCEVHIHPEKIIKNVLMLDLGS
jgi:hypothetical protein